MFADGKFPIIALINYFNSLDALNCIPDPGRRDPHEDLLAVLQEEAGCGEENGQEFKQVLPLHEVSLDPQGEALGDNSMGKSFENRLKIN